jgi:hypothetical protein
VGPSARWRGRARDPARPWRCRLASPASEHQASGPPRPWSGRPPPPAADHPPGRPACHPPSGRDPGGLEEAGLVQAKPGHTVQARGSSTSGVPWSTTARMMVAQPTPRSRATAATTWASLPTRRQASARARSVSTARGPIAAARSVQVRTPQAGSRQRHRAAADRQVAHPDRAAAVRGGPHAAAPTADHRGRGLDGELPFATHEFGRDDLEAVQAEQRRPGPTTVLTHLGPPLAGRQTSARYARPQVPFGSSTATSATPHHAS